MKPARSGAPGSMRSVTSGIVVLCGGVLLAPHSVSGQSRFEVAEASIAEIQAALQSGEVTSVQLVDAYLERIRAYDLDGPRLNAVVRVNPAARSEASALDQERAAVGPRGPLHGIPVLMKDNFDVRDMPTTGSSLALAGSVPPDDAFQVRKLREAGAIVLAKTNMHELAAGITTISSLGGQTRNPYDPRRNPGGSSGGTGAAVAASFAAVGWGSDTCGSIRIPASHNDLVGLRPTKGLSSIDGVIPLAHTQDVAGPLARSFADLAIALDATVGYDPADPATEAVRGRTLPSFVDALGSRDLSGARIGVLREFFGDAPEDGVMASIVEAALDSLAALGAHVVEIDPSDLNDLREGSGVIAYEFDPDLEDYLAATPEAPVRTLTEILDGGLHHRALEGNFRRRTTTATRDGDDYLAALAKREEVLAAVIETLDAGDFDVLAFPTMRRQPAIIGEGQSGSSCWLSAHSGVPALSVPVGFTTDGLPVGLELVGAPFTDVELVALGHAVEAALPNRRAPRSTPPLSAADPVTVRLRLGYDGNGAPFERARVELVADPVAGSLRYSFETSGIAPDDLLAVVLGRGSETEDGAALHRLGGPGVLEGAGEIRPSPAEWADLDEGRLNVRLYTLARPAGVRARVALPARR